MKQMLLKFETIGVQFLVVYMKSQKTLKKIWNTERKGELNNDKDGKGFTPNN